MLRCKRILVPLDGSATAERALPIATDLARRFRVPLHIVRVVASIELLCTEQPSTPEAFTREISVAEAMAEEYLATVRRQLAASGLAVTSESRRGNPARQLLRAVSNQDVVVMTTSGRGENPVMGSVAAWVITQASVPVLIIPSADRSPHSPLALPVEPDREHTPTGDST